MNDPLQPFRIENSRALPIEGATSSGATKEDEVIQVTSVLQPEPLAEDDQTEMRRRASVADPPSRRPRLTKEELEHINSPSEAHLGLVRAFAEDHGLKVIRESKNRHDVVLEGPVRAMNEAFQVRLEDFEHARGSFRAHSQDIQIPGTLRDVVTGVVGLDNVPFTRAFASPGVSTNVGPGPYTPLQIADHYNFPDSTGAGQRIAILCFGDCGFHDSDLDSFFNSVVNVAKPTINKFLVNGATGAPLPYSRLVEMTEFFKNKTPPSVKFTPHELSWGKATLEATLDIQIAGSIANGATIDVYFTTDDWKGWYEALYAAIESEPTVISISWGAKEAYSPGYGWGEWRMDIVEPALEQAAQTHVTVCCSSGDFGSLDTRYTTGATPPSIANAHYPSSSPHAIGCGGTMFLPKYSGCLAIILYVFGISARIEKPWNTGSRYYDGREATGGGVSGYFALPGFQSSANVPTHSSLNGQTWRSYKHGTEFHGRGVPDVAAYADDTNGYRIFIGNQEYPVGGTSCSAPLWAALIARMSEKLGAPVGWLNELIYETSYKNAFRDIVGGNNRIASVGSAAYHEADTYWDACCGLGVSDGASLLQCIKDSLSTASTNSP